VRLGTAGLLGASGTLHFEGVWKQFEFADWNASICDVDAPYLGRHNDGDSRREEEHHREN